MTFFGKNRFDENDLVAYHLQELSPRKRRAIERALTLNPQLAADSEAIAATLRMFDKTEAAPMVDAGVLDRNWNMVRPSLGVLQPRSNRAQWYWRAAAAALLALLAGVTAYVWRQGDVAGTADVRGVANQPDRAAQPHAGSGLRPGHGRPHGGGSVKAPGHSKQDRGEEAAMAPLPASLHNEGALLPVEPALKLALLEGLPLPDPPQQAQGVNPAPPPAPAASPAPVRKQHEMDLSVGVFGDSIAGRSTTSTSGGIAPTSYSRSQTAVPSAGVLATFHQQLRPGFGYRFSSSWTRTTFNYTSSSSNVYGAYSIQGAIPTHILEFSAAYVIEGPRSRRVSTFADVGGGALYFLPKAPDTRYTFRPAPVGGVGADFKLSGHWALRAEYRGVFFKGTGFHYAGDIPVEMKYTLSSEPTVSLTYRFGKPTK